jgi:nitroimidazol reductase NimA-like FMN-containing flavoprotein (pyridoxamine 5'-phosphate oxidase superfamily)
MIEILKKARYITIAMCKGDQPYLVTLSHGYDSEKHCIYFHCSDQGKKIDYMRANNLVWGQALVDHGYVQGACDHLYATTQFRGRVTFIQDKTEKIHALTIMIHALDNDPQRIIDKQLNDDSLIKVTIGRIDINAMSSKKSTKVIISV